MYPSISIVVVEDKIADFHLIKEILSSNIKIQVEFMWFDDGKKAQHYFLQLLDNGKQEITDLIFININIPGFNGLDLLQFIKSNETLKIIPTVIISQSKNTNDILRCYTSYANFYLTKPEDIHEYTGILIHLVDFIIKYTKLPTRIS